MVDPYPHLVRNSCRSIIEERPCVPDDIMGRIGRRLNLFYQSAMQGGKVIDIPAFG